MHKKFLLVVCFMMGTPETVNIECFGEAVLVAVVRCKSGNNACGFNACSVLSAASGNNKAKTRQPCAVMSKQ